MVFVFDSWGGFLCLVGILVWVGWNGFIYILEDGFCGLEKVFGVEID